MDRMSRGISETSYGCLYSCCYYLFLAGNWCYFHSITKRQGRECIKDLEKFDASVPETEGWKSSNHLKSPVSSQPVKLDRLDLIYQRDIIPKVLKYSEISSGFKTLRKELSVSPSAFACIQVGFTGLSYFLTYKCSIISKVSPMEINITLHATCLLYLA